MMNKKLQPFILILLAIVLCTNLSAQKILHKANKQFRLKHYHEAIDSYLKTLEKYPNHLEAKSYLAESYRMTNQLVKAEQAYARIMPEEFLDPVHIRNYGITLMKMAKYNDAHYQFELYKVYEPQDAQHYQLSCEFAHHLYKRVPTHEIEHVGVNTPNSDFGVTYFGDQMIFSSFRNDVETSVDDEKRQELVGNMLYTADLSDDLRAENVSFLRSGIAERKNIGPICYAPKAEICAFTRNKIENGGAHVTGDDSYHSIYIADVDSKGDWTNERPFRYNEFGTSTGFPSLAFDGSALYFSSNRVGGYGGYDIYVSYWKEGEWTYPQNLGEEINTAGNEITPFFTGTDLYFSSDYHHGMGGYDIFHSEVLGGKWTHPVNMANGINSPGDDYYPSIKSDKEGMFFSSNRLGGRGMDDIYLAIPLKAEDFLVSLDEDVPPAVELSSINSELSLIPESNVAEAKAVSQKETIEIKVISNGPEISQENQEELPTWGFVPEKTENEERNLLFIGAIPSLSLLHSLPLKIEELIIPNATRSDFSVADFVFDEESNFEDDHSLAVEESIIGNDNLEEDFASTEDIEQKPEAHKIPSYDIISAKRAPFNLDLAGAKRVALGEILPASPVYFIQLASLSKTTGFVSKYKSLSKYGNLYKVFKSSSTKIKLGYFMDKQEANQILRSVKMNGFSDAFITKDDLNTVQLELIIANDAQDTYTSYKDTPESTSKNYGNTSSTTTNSGGYSDVYNSEYTLNNKPKSKYKIRLASYEDPIWFDIEKAKTLGRIEQWTKNNWTIFILGSFDTFEEAESARIKAANKGFSDAEIVIDSNGILQRLKRN